MELVNHGNSLLSIMSCNDLNQQHKIIISLPSDEAPWNRYPELGGVETWGLGSCNSPKMEAN